MNTERYDNRPPIFIRPSPPCGKFNEAMPWGSPRPPFAKNYTRIPFAMTPEGLRMPGNLQFPPMFGPRGATIPPRFMAHKNQFPMNRNKSQEKSFEFWCDPCDRGFLSEQLFNEHNIEHQKCGIDGCTFTAHVNVVTKHIQMQHSSGLYKKICKTDTPEDIKNWINERKKNYPTQVNIARKKAQDKECIERGEKLKEDKSRFNKKNNNFSKSNTKISQCRGSSKNNRDFSSKRISNIKLKRDINHTYQPSKKLNLKKEPSENTQTEELFANLKPFKGTSQLVRDDINIDNTLECDDIDIEDDEWKDEINSDTQDSNKPLVCSALSNLISAYDSSDGEGPEEQTIIKDPMDITYNCRSLNLQNNDYKNDKANNYILNGDESRPDVIKIEKTPDPNVNSISDSKATSGRKGTRKRSDTEKNVTAASACKKKNRLGTSVNQRSLKRRMPKTLLEKLLEKDIRKERNAILQCVRYIVRKNFFNTTSDNSVKKQ